MAVSTPDILEVLAAHDIRPGEETRPDEETHPGEDDTADINFPDVGQIKEGETVYSTSIREVLGTADDPESAPGAFDGDDPRLREWWERIERIIDGQDAGVVQRGITELPGEDTEPIEPHCAWYCPIHFFGHGWGIYIRENCILSCAVDIATFVNWPSVSAPRQEIARQLLRSAFYVFFLHEQFHHKVESLGFRLLVSTGTDRYRAYKHKVYRPTYNTSGCLEESLANAESYRRLDESRYVRRLDPAIRKGLRKFLKSSISGQPPGYREGIDYLSEPSYRKGLHDLQSRILDGMASPTTPPKHWSVAPNMITSLADITDEIYVILPHGAHPIFRPATIDPGHTTSSHRLAGALIRHYGYKQIPGGIGSHVKLEKPGAETIILPGNRQEVTPGVIKQVLNAVGGGPVSRLPDLLAGKL